MSIAQSIPRTTARVDDLLAIAREAGAAIMTVYARLDDGVEIRTKGDGSPVTEADLAAHEVIQARLSALTPDIVVVSEENTASHASRTPANLFWLVDPLDGTKEFTKKTGEFTVNIALIDAGRPVFGVVYVPATGEMFWGGADAGAFRQLGDGPATPLQVADYPARDGERYARTVRVIASKSHMDDATRAYIDAIQPHELLQAGSSLKFCRIAQGEADIYPRLGPTCEWDTGAAQAVVEGAGGTVRQVDGTPLAYGKPDVLNPYFVVSAERA